MAAWQGGVSYTPMLPERASRESCCPAAALLGRECEGVPRAPAKLGRDMTRADDCPRAAGLSMCSTYRTPTPISSLSTLMLKSARCPKGGFTTRNICQVSSEQYAGPLAMSRVHCGRVTLGATQAPRQRRALSARKVLEHQIAVQFHQRWPHSSKGCHTNHHEDARMRGSQC